MRKFETEVERKNELKGEERRKRGSQAGEEQERGKRKAGRKEKERGSGGAASEPGTPGDRKEEGASLPNTRTAQQPGERRL